MLALSRDIGTSYKTAFVLAHKMREAMAAELKGRMVGGEGKVAEVDGGYFGGYVRPANIRINRRDRRFSEHQSGKRKAVVVIRERERPFTPCRVPHRSPSAVIHPGARRSRAQRSMPTKAAPGTACTATTK